MGDNDSNEFFNKTNLRVKELLIDQSNILFDRLESNYSLLKSSAYTLFGIVIAVINIHIISSLFLIKNNNLAVNNFIFVIILFYLLSMLSTVYCLINIMMLSKFKNPDIFGECEENKQKEIMKFAKRNKISEYDELMEDILEKIEECYCENHEIYDDKAEYMKISLSSFIISNIIYIIFIFYILL